MGDVVHLPEQVLNRRALITKAERRLDGRDMTLLVEVWVYPRCWTLSLGGVERTSFDVCALFNNPPDARYAIDHDTTFADIDTFQTAEHARLVGSIIAQHYRVPLIDHSAPDQAA